MPVSSPTPAKDLFHPDSLQPLQARLRSVTPTTPRLWGRMTAHQMICHLADGFRMALRDRTCESVATPLWRTLVRWVALHLPFPWPKGRIRTVREADQEVGGTPPTDFERDREELEDLMRRFSAAGDEMGGREHPMFGPLSRSEWGRWGYRHVDHHLRQFGA